MPISKQAIKKLRHDKKRTIAREIMDTIVKKLVKTARRHPSPKTLSLAFQALDKAAKRKGVHPNKASRLKSRLAKLLKK